MSVYPYPRNTAWKGVPFVLLDTSGVPIDGVPTGGAFTLALGSETTSSLSFNAAASDVQAALEALTAIGTGNVACAGGPLPSAAVDITFAAALDNVNPLSVDAALTGGDSPSLGVVTLAQGNAPVVETQSVWISGADAGTFLLSLDGTQWTTAIDWNAAAAAVQAAVEALSAVGSGNASVSGSGAAADPWVIVFAQALGNVAEFQGDGGGLNMGTVNVDTQAQFETAVEEQQRLSCDYGRPAGYLTRDGASAVALTNTAYALGHGQWAVDLTAAETNAAIVGLLFRKSGAQPVALVVPTTSEPANLGLLSIDASGVVRANDAQGSALATAAGTPSGSLWNATRAAYLDKLNISGNLAASAEVLAVQNNTQATCALPAVMERPATGTLAYRVELLLHDTAGNMEHPDADPTVDVVNQSGTSRNGNLGNTQMTLITTGRYRVTYNVAATHELEQLLFVFSVTENGVTRLFTDTSLVVGSASADFTAADRAKLEALYGKLPSAAYLRGTNQSDGGLSPTDLSDIDGLLVDPDNASIAAIKAKTDNLPAQPAAQGDPMTLAAAACTTVADAVLARGVDAVEATAAEHSLCYVILAMSQSSTTAHAGKLTVFRTDGVTEFARKSISSASGAEPITGVS